MALLFIQFDMPQASAQDVTVFDGFPPIPGDSDTTTGLRQGINQRVLVIPVISQDTAFDPENNLVDAFNPADPNFHQDLVNKFAEVNDLWIENSYGLVSFDVDVLERYYQLPKERDHYFNPAYQPPRLNSTDIRGEPIDVPGGQLRLDLHISDADESTIIIEFLAADSPYTFDALNTKIGDEIAFLGDKLELFLDPCGVDCRRLRFDMGQIHAVEGGFIHIDFSASDDVVLDALGLDRPTIDVTAATLTGEGIELPYTSNAGNTLTLTLDNGINPPESYSWVMVTTDFNTPEDFVAAHGTTNANVAINVNGGQLRFDVTPTIPQPFDTIRFTGPNELLDRLGLDASEDQEGLVRFSKRNTIRGDRRIITGQGIAAYILNELTRSPAAPGPDPFPNQAINAANDAALTALLQTEVDPYRSVSLIFLDAPNKRAGASGGYIPIGLTSGDYEFTHITTARLQLFYDFSTTAIIAHETGHNIGFADLYNNSNGEYDPMLRYPQDWDIMDNHPDKNHTGVWHKEIDNSWISDSGGTVLEFAEPGSTGISNRRLFLLTPLEYSDSAYDDNLDVSGAPPVASLTKAIRLPIGLGLAAGDHFLLVQNRQPGELFSQDLPQHTAAATAGGVYITDVISRRSFDFFRPQTRNFVHPLTDTALALSVNVPPIIDETPIADINLLLSYPAYDGLEIDIIDEIPGPGAFANRPSYVLDIIREQKGFLELSLAPWGAPPYESVDIWLEHGDKAVLSSTPLSGNGEPARWAENYNLAANNGNPLNWVRALITNSGTVDATDVIIRVRVNQPGGMGDSGTWVVLGSSDPVDIAAGDSSILQVPWNPSVNRHTCVQVEIFRWNSVLGDRDPWNNRTQENVSLFQPTSDSPWGETSFSFEIANGRSFPIDVALEPMNLPRGYIIDLGQSFVHVPANDAVTVNGILSLDDEIIPPPETVPGALSCNPDDPDCFGDPGGKIRQDVFHLSAAVVGDEYQVPAGGITYVSIPSKRVDVDVGVGVDASGRIVVNGATQPPVGGIDTEIELRYPSGRFEWIPVTTGSDGSISATIPPKEVGPVSVSVKIPPGQGAAPTTTGENVVNTRFPGGVVGRGARRVDLMVGGLITDDELPLDSGLGFGLRYSQPFKSEWRIGGEVALFDTDDAQDTGTLIQVQLNLDRHFGVPPIQPFLLLGVGATHFNGRALSDTASHLSVGTGLDFSVRSDFSVRLDVRYVVVDDLLSSGTTNNWHIAVSGGFRF